MPNQPISSVENNFTKGLVTEFTGLNFPENAATDADNCEFSIVGDVLRREGINAEKNFMFNLITTPNKAISTFIWTNPGGDGNAKLFVRQDAGILSFFRINSVSLALPLSAQLSQVVSLSSFVARGGTLDNTLECQYASGNGYLFVFHPSCDPIYYTYDAGTITGNRIVVQIRDFLGVPDSLSSNTRPTTLSTEHNYNLINQGWVAGNPWSTVSSSSIAIGLGSKTFTVSAGLTAAVSDEVTIISNSAGLGGPVGPMMSGNITAYAGTSMTINVTSGSTGWFGTTVNDWTIVPRDTAYIASWFSALGNYPSNADVWWYFKNSSGVFDPSTTANNISLGAGNAPRGHFILDAFSQQRGVVSNLIITDIQTTVRPSTGTWFQGRIWYTGVDAQQPAQGDANYYTWSESIYFSKIVNSVDDLGHCYQTNDPTSENLFDLLPTDGGVIQIQGCGKIYKLFPIQNGMLVFAANGIWFITGSSGIGFSANDYTITKISSVQSISNTSFVDVQGLPYFWNEEGIYSVQPVKTAGNAGNLQLQVDPITVGTILTFYNSIPTGSKKYVRGDYNPIDYVIQWTYRNTIESSVADRYHFDRILNFSTYNKAFFPYSVRPDAGNTPFLNGVNYISYPQIFSDTPLPGFKYPMSFTAVGNTYNTFAEENDSRYVDWFSITGGTEYESYFVTGYKLHGQGQRRFQMGYLYTFSRNDVPTSFYIQGIWDYANSGNSGRYSTKEYININKPNYGMVFRRHKIRGQGLVLQIKVSSVDRQPFDIMGWSSWENSNTSV